jgi:hypothetical protein
VFQDLRQHGHETSWSVSDTETILPSTNACDKPVKIIGPLKNCLYGSTSISDEIRFHGVDCHNMCTHTYSELENTCSVASSWQACSSFYNSDTKPEAGLPVPYYDIVVLQSHVCIQK